MITGDLRDKAIKQLSEAGIDKEDARFDVDAIISAIDDWQEFQKAIDRRASSEPIAYILGKAFFYNEEYKVAPGVLIPRSDTETLVEAALQFLGRLEFPMGEVGNIPKGVIRANPRIADLCTGSGCIGISLGNSLYAAGDNPVVTLGDIADEALKCSTENADSQVKFGRDNISINRVDVLSEAALDSLAKQTGKFDVVVSNPPYVTDEEMLELPKDVKDFEPHLALRADDNGLIFYKSLANSAKALLVQGGALIVEHGYLQGQAVRDIFTEAGLAQVITIKDYGDNDRVTFGILE